MKKNIADFIEVLKRNELILELHVNDDIKHEIICSLTDNSRESVKGTMFVCKGSHFKSEYLKDAITRGAVCYITDQKELIDETKPCILVHDIRKTMGILGNFYYEDAWKAMKVIGITGTKGKSTTAYFLKSIIDNYSVSIGEKPAGILSSIENFDGEVFEESHLTTPEPLRLHWHFNNMIKNGIRYCIMEVSSQALKYGRVAGIEFDIGCFLNIGEDHISDIEHRDFRDYFISKSMILDSSKQVLLSDTVDFDEIGVDISKYGDRISIFGSDEKDDFQVTDITKKSDGFDFKLRYLGETKTYSICLGGTFNVYNAAAAVAAAKKLGIPDINIFDGLSSAKVSGRMELFADREKDITVIVDYAHNKLSFQKLFESVKEEYPGKKIVSVFGCPGGKAFARRKDLGEIAGEYSDLVVITEEDHGEEDLHKICTEILTHASGRKAHCLIIEDREEAIQKAVSYYSSDAVVLLTGKGRETRQKRGTEYIETLSDVDIVENLLISMR